MTTIDYFCKLSDSYPLLTPEQEQYLGRKGEKKSLKDRRKLVLHNLRLAVKFGGEAHRRYKCILEADDFVGFAYDGLEEAAKRYAAGRGSKFCTYAMAWIRQRIGRGVQENAHLIRVPAHVTEKRYKIHRAVTKLMQTQQDMPTLGEVAREIGLRPTQVLKYHDNIPVVSRLDAIVSDDNSTTLGHLTADESVEDPSILLRRKDDYRAVRKALCQLDERQAFVLRLRMGFEGESYSLEEVADKLKVTRERTRQIQAAALRNIARMLVKWEVAERDPGLFENERNASLKWAKGRRAKQNRASSRLRERKAERSEDLRLLDKGAIDSLDVDDLSALA